MRRAEEMAARLHPLLREGPVLRGLLDVVANELDVWEEDGYVVQRAHWFDSTFERDEIVRLGRLLDLVPEPWQSGRLFRAWVHAYRRALLADGASTPRAVRGFVERFAGEVQRATGVKLVHGRDEWGDTPAPDRPALVENPRVRRHRTFASPGRPGVEPLGQLDVHNRGQGQTPAEFLFVGLPGGGELSPAIVNFTTGQALVYLGAVPTGRRLRLMPRDGTVRARLEGRDVSDRLRSVEGVVAGRSWSVDDTTTPAKQMLLRRGVNRMWFVPLAHHDVPAFDRGRLAMPSPDFTTGRFDRSRFERATFDQEPAVALTVSWDEERPATFHVDLPAWSMSHGPDRLDGALTLREQLTDSLDRSVKRLSAAGVEAQVRMRPLRELQPSSDRLVPVRRLELSDVGGTGADRSPVPGGTFDVTEFDGSNWLR